MVSAASLALTLSM